MKIWITWANWQLWKIVVELLKEKVWVNDIIPLVRNIESYWDKTLPARNFDYNNISDIEKWLEGIDVLLLISGSEMWKRLQQHKDIISQAKKVWVKRIIYTSLLYADTSTLPMAWEHLETENFIKSLDMNYTILRNGWYNENYTQAIPWAIKSWVYIWSAWEWKISSASRRDFARAWVEVILWDNHDYKTYELAWDNSYSLQELVNLVNKITWKDIIYKNLDVIEYEKILISFGFPQEFAKISSQCDFRVSENQLYSTSKDLHNLINSNTTDIWESIKEVI